MKSKIEEKIKNAREATNEMFAALEELNESLKEKEAEKYEPKHKEPIIGEMAIMWRSDKGKALCRIYGDYEDGRHYDSVGIWADNAILFESPEQYKAFLKS